MPKESKSKMKSRIMKRIKSKSKIKRRIACIVKRHASFFS